MSIANKLGDSLFVFEQAAPKNSPLDPRGPPDGMPQLAIPQVQSAHLQFTKNHFQSNRNLSNVFFIGQETVNRRVSHFINNKGWYDRKGIPYTLGFLFYGRPGCGKTSSIKAIANETGRHIINIKLENIKTKTQLHNLFFNDQLHVMDEQDNYNKTETYKIPITKRLYVIEDIDCMSDIVMDRGIKADIADKEKEARNERTRVQLETDRRPRLNANGMFAPNELVTPPMYGANIIEDDPWLSTKSSSAPAPKQDDQLTLASLLNVLDGTLEATGRMLILTTNYPDKLDKALIRKGRIDLTVEFKLATKDVVLKMFSSFYDEEFPEDLASKIPDENWTPADISAVLFKNFDFPRQAAKDIVQMNRP